MNLHLTDQQITDLINKRLSVDDLLRVDQHLSGCEQCQSASASALAGDTVLLDSLLIDVDADPHLSFEQLAGCADELLDPIEREIADLHLNDCRSCTMQLDDLLVLRREMEAESVAAPGEENSSRGFWQSIRDLGWPSIALPAAALLALGVFVMYWVSPEQQPVETATVASVSNTNEKVQTSATPAPAETITPVEPEQEPSKPVISLNDGGVNIGLDDDGRVVGIEDPSFESEVASVLQGKPLRIQSGRDGLSQANGSLMGSGKNGVPFALTDPVGKVIESSRPTLRWKALDGAESYRVEVFDGSFNKVASSPPIKNTRWQTDAALPRGKVYLWQVTAVVDGEEVRSPVRPAPDAKFKVIDGASAKRISDARARHRGSHLLLGLAYAEAGLLSDAEREFVVLAKQNPSSNIPKKLLQQVRSAR